MTKVKHGFSIPPNGKDGGITSKSYSFQTYDPQMSVAVFNMLDVSENSSAAASTIASSAHTFELNKRYVGMKMLAVQDNYSPWPDLSRNDSTNSNS